MTRTLKPSLAYVVNQDADSPIYLAVQDEYGGELVMYELSGKHALLISTALNDAVLRSHFAMRELS